MMLAVESEWPIGLNFSSRSNLSCFYNEIGYITAPKGSIFINRERGINKRFNNIFI